MTKCFVVTKVTLYKPNKQKFEYLRDVLTFGGGGA